MQSAEGTKTADGAAPPRDKRYGAGQRAPALEPRITVAEVARRYRVSDWTVRAWLGSGALRGSNADGRWTTTWDAVFAFEGRLSAPRGAARERAQAPLWTVQDLAGHFRRDPETIRRRLRRGAISGRRIQGNWYAEPDAVRAYEQALGAGPKGAGDAA